MTEKHPPIFDSNRNNQINEDNKFGSDFKRFVMRHVDIYRKELEKEDKENPTPKKRYLQISVVDTGIGIAKEDHHKLFKLFGFVKDS